MIVLRKSGVKLVVEYKVDFKICDQTKTELKKYDSSYLSSRETYIYYGVVPIFGVLYMTINDILVFQISDSGFKKLRKEKNLGFTKKSSKSGFNGMNLFAWIIDQNEVALKLLDNKLRNRIELEGHGLDFDIERKRDSLFITFNKYLKSKNPHWLSPHLAHTIENQEISLDIFVKESVRNSDLFINELIDINPYIKNNPEFQELININRDLKSKTIKEISK